MRNHAPSKPLSSCRILPLGGSLRKRARKAWNYRFTDPNAYKNAIKEYAKALRLKKQSSWKNFCGGG
jgi:hypothetical protein